jgi:hypothetical protein
MAVAVFFEKSCLKKSGRRACPTLRYIPFDLRRDEVVRLRDEEGLSWRVIGKQLGIPAMTALDSYRNGCTETVVAETPKTNGKRKSKPAVA